MRNGTASSTPAPSGSGMPPQKQGNLAAMRQEYDLALDVAKRFSARDPSKQDWQRDLALIQTKVGDTLKIQRKLNDALQYYRMALLISQQLAAKEPDKSEWQRNVATTRTRIGDVLVELKEL